MKLKNKKTGEIADIEINSHHLTIVYEDGRVEQFFFDSLKDLAEWEDYEEPKQWYGLNPLRDVGFEPLEYEGFEDLYKHAKELGIAFETKEEAEKAVEKLKAWKRLKDKGFRFDGYNACSVDYDIDEQYRKYISEDLNLLFGGGE